MVKSKYANDFDFVNKLATCKWCAYKTNFNPGDPTTILRSHLANHHKERLELISQSDQQKKGKNDDAAAQLKHQQDALKRGLNLQENEAASSSSSSNKIRRIDDPKQPKIDRVLSLFHRNSEAKI
jgi:hypothetical protein